MATFVAPRSRSPVSVDHAHIPHAALLNTFPFDLQGSPQDSGSALPYFSHNPAVYLLDSGGFTDRGEMPVLGIHRTRGMAGARENQPQVFFFDRRFLESPNASSLKNCLDDLVHGDPSCCLLSAEGDCLRSLRP